MLMSAVTRPLLCCGRGPLIELVTRFDEIQHGAIKNLKMEATQRGLIVHQSPSLGAVTQAFKGVSVEACRTETKCD